MSNLSNYFCIIRQRRQILQGNFNIARQMKKLEESCVPSYAHTISLSAHVAWMRLYVASRLWMKQGGEGPVLDFGCGTGELYHFLENAPAYHFIEGNDLVAEAVMTYIPDAQQKQIEGLKPGFYGTIFALDSLEHNDNIEALFSQLLVSLKPGGTLILSGPTENALYRFGRWVSGFEGDYHTTNIYDIEEMAGKQAHLIHRQRVPLGIPLFNLTCWQGNDHE